MADITLDGVAFRYREIALTAIALTEVDTRTLNERGQLRHAEQVRSVARSVRALDGLLADGSDV